MLDVRLLLISDQKSNDIIIEGSATIEGTKRMLGKVGINFNSIGELLFFFYATHTYGQIPAYNKCVWSDHSMHWRSTQFRHVCVTASAQIIDAMMLDLLFRSRQLIYWTDRRMHYISMTCVTVRPIVDLSDFVTNTCSTYIDRFMLCVIEHQKTVMGFAWLLRNNSIRWFVFVEMVLHLKFDF